jgi:hypothetical protein
MLRQGAVRLTQIRNPKVETRKKSEGQTPNLLPPQREASAADKACFVFRDSDFLRVSAFGLRISGPDWPSSQTGPGDAPGGLPYL